MNFEQDYFYHDISIDLDNWDAKADAIGGNFKKAVTVGLDRGMDALVKNTRKKLMEYIGNYDLGGTNLEANIDIVRSGFDVMSITANDYVLYIEFGTGIVGENATHHPDENMFGWFQGHDINDHGYAGWVYIGRDNKKHWTAGQKSKPVLYHTLLYVKNYGVRTINTYVNKELKKYF